MPEEPERYPVDFSKAELDLACKALRQINSSVMGMFFLATEWGDLRKLEKRLQEKSYELHETIH